MLVDATPLLGFGCLGIEHANDAVGVADRGYLRIDDHDRQSENGQRIDKHLLLTRYDPARARRGEIMTVENVLEILSIPLLGIIPESGEVLRSSNVGAPVTLGSPGSAPAQAYLEAARRLTGADNVIVAAERPSLISRWFNRTAA